MMVAVSPGPRYGRQSLNVAKNTAMHASISSCHCAGRRPATPRAAVPAARCARCAPGRRELFGRHRQRKQCAQENAPCIPGAAAKMFGEDLLIRNGVEDVHSVRSRA